MSYEKALLNVFALLLCWGHTCPGHFREAGMRQTSLVSLSRLSLVPRQQNSK